jgi:hypothetical protein
MRLYALEQWAQRPGEVIDPVTFGLVDEDEQVRSRAQELYQRHLAQETTATVPVETEHAESRIGR